MIRLGYEVRPDERSLVVSAGLAAALAGCGLALVSSAADALFLSRVGFRHLGTMFAVSSAALILVLGYVGAVADRMDRGRLLVLLTGLAAVVLGLLGGLLDVFPRGVSIAALVLGKQFGAAIDLAFWVLVAERFDARQGRRLVPILVAAQGVGLVGGAFAVAPLAHSLGAGAALLAGACGFAVAVVPARRFAGLGTARPLPSRARPPAPRRRLTLGSGWAAVRQSPLSRRLAVLVGVAGIFAPILYYLLGAAAAASFDDEAGIAAFLGQYRGVVQLLTLGAAFVAPGVLARSGVAPALLLAPIGAVLAAVGLSISLELAVVVVAQASARVLDTAVQTPAEKLVQNLLPRHVRGRVQGFLDGVAKRAGAIIGGLAASALVIWPSVLVAATLLVALVWLAVALHLRAGFAELAVAELASRGRGEDDPEDDEVLASLVDERSIDRLRGDLAGAAERRSLAIELVTQLGERGRLDSAQFLAGAAVAASGPARVELVRALDALGPKALSSADLDRVARSLAETLQDEHGPEAARAPALRVAGRLLALEDGETVAELGAAIRRCVGDAVDKTTRSAARAALARARGDETLLDGLLEELADGDEEERRAAASELCSEIAWQARRVQFEPERLFSLCRALTRAVRRDASVGEGGCVPALSSLTAAIERCAAEKVASAELVLLRADARSLAVRVCDAGDAGRSGDAAGDPGDCPDPRAGALRLLAALADPDDGNRMARALGDGDEEVRRAAAAGLRALGDRALEFLLVAASFGRRAARNQALSLLRDLRVSSASLDHLIESELMEIDQTSARLAPLAQLEGGSLVVRRLEERVDESAHTLFLVLEARLGDPAIGAAARTFLRARDRIGRARALETLDTVLPRALARRALAPLDDAPLDARSDRACRRLGSAPLEIDEAVRVELGGADPLARALVVHALGSSGRANHRDAIAQAAADAALSLDPISMIRRITGSSTEPATAGADEPDPLWEDEMPRSVETMMALSQLPIFADLTTRQLSDLASVVRWEKAALDAVIVAEGDPGDAMYFVLSGRVRVAVTAGEATRELGELGTGELFGEMALFEDAPRSATVVAAEKTRLGRIERADFEELVEDVPGIALSICRVLSRRVRQANLASQRRPAAT